MIALLTWADEHLPWIRGKFLMMGMRFPDLEAMDSLDLLHVLMEEDNIILLEQRSSRNRVRNVIYREMYKQPNNRYADFVADEDSSNASGGSDAPRAARSSSKPYFPPTPIEELPGILGEPMEF